MKWFKHLAGSLNNSFIFELIEQFGGDGYLVFFGTLEIMADEFDIYNPGLSRISIKKLTKNLQLSRQKLTKILKFCDKKAKENPQKNVAFFVDIDKTHATIKCNRLAVLCDNHTQKLVRDTSKPLQSKEEVTSSQEAEVRSKKKEEDNNSMQQQDQIPIKKIITAWNTAMDEKKGVMPKVLAVKPSTGRYTHVKARWKEHPDMKTWEAVIFKAAVSDFLNGRTKGRDRAFSFDWIVQSSENFTKVMEGKYDNTNKGGGGADNGETSTGRISDKYASVHERVVDCG